ncbi:lipid II:glycine glycyltransferase FemX [Enterococcus sp. LJL99]
MPILNTIDVEQQSRYDAFIRHAKYSSITQETKWGQVKNNWEPVYVYIEEEGQIIAAMSILIIHNREESAFAYVTKGPVLNEIKPDFIQKLVAEAEEELFKRDVFLLRMDPEIPYCEEVDLALRENGFIVRNRELSGSETIQPRFNMLVDLRGKTEEEVLAERYSKTRYRIRYALKKGLVAKVTNDRKEIETFYQLYKMTSERHGISYRPKAYFDRLADSFLASDQMKIIIVSIDGKPDAAGLCFLSGDKVWYMYAGSTHQNQVLMAPYLVNWEGIKWAIEKGCSYYDLGGVFSLDNSDGLFQFKHGMIRPNIPIEYIGEIDKVYNQEKYELFLQPSLPKKEKQVVESK